MGAGACDDSDGHTAATVVDELDTDGNVPFDNDVAPGVGTETETETDEGNNMGFDTDDLGRVGNQTNPNH